MTNSQAGQAEINERTIELAQAPSRSGAAIELGSIIHDSYKVLKLLGRGGMGSVYQVRHVKTQADYALKVLDACSSESSARRFEIEAKAANRLDHPNLIKVHDSGLINDGQPFFVMEYVPGMTLADHLQQKGRMSLAHALNIFIQVGFALAYAHENGLIHRDLKPSNIMLIENTASSLCSSVKLVDLGIAKWNAEEEYNQQTLTRTGEIFGSPLYMSPEQCMGIPVDRRSDLYSLGCVIYETLTGAPPVMGENALSTMMKHQSEKPLSLREASLGIEFPQSIEQVVARLLEKAPDKRYSNAQLLTAALVNIQQSMHETEEAQNQSLLTQAQKKRIAKEADALFSTRNIIGALIILASFGLGYLTGNSTIQSAPAVAAVKSGSIKSIEEKLAGVPSGYVDIIDGESPKGKDPYMGTGKGFFTTRSGNQTVCHFPEKTIGRVGVSKSELLPQYISDARGVVKVPAGPLSFSGNAEIFLYPRLLEKFRPGELGTLELQDAHRGAKELMRTIPLQKNLTFLNLSGTWLDNEDIAMLGKLPKLQHLFLCSSQIDANTIANIKTLHNLKSIDITDSIGPSKFLEALSTSKEIQYLRLKKCDIKAKDLEALGKMSSLTSLDLKGNKSVSDEGLKSLASLKNLEVLNLENCPISIKGLASLKSLPLKRLTISDSNLSKVEIEEAKKMIPGIYLKSNQSDSHGRLHYVLDSFTIK